MKHLSLTFFLSTFLFLERNKEDDKEFTFLRLHAIVGGMFGDFNIIASSVYLGLLPTDECQSLANDLNFQTTFSGQLKVIAAICKGNSVSHCGNLKCIPAKTTYQFTTMMRQKKVETQNKNLTL